MAESTDSKKDTIVICVDGGEHSKYALDYYLENFHTDRNEVQLLHVMEPVVLTSQSMYISGEVWDQMVKAEKIKMKDIEEDAGEKLKLAKADWAFRGVMGGRPGEIICSTAKEKNATLIILGTRGMGTIRRTILGSVSDYVLHHAHCPVCICRQ